MKDKILFSERQRFSQWWLWLILLSVNGLFLFGIFRQVISGQPFGNKPISNGGLIVAECVVLLVTLLFINFRLDTRIKTDGIQVRFFPLHWKFKFYPWDMVSKSFIRKYAAISEYGGWGLRFGIFGAGKAYNVTGDEGLQLEFRDGKKLLIGTNKPAELEKALNEIDKNRA